MACVRGELDAVVSPVPVEVSDATICPILWDEFQLLRPEDVDKVLAAMRPTTCSCDPCPSWLIKASRGGLTGWVQGVIKASLREGVVPAALKGAVARPILKKPTLDPTVLENYLPVANAPFLGKVLERAVAGQLQALLEDTDDLDPFQSGFPSGYGTESALVALRDDLYRERDGGVQPCQFYSISQRLLIPSTMGTVLSPMLVSIYMKPLGALMSGFGAKCRQYADATQLYVSTESGEAVQLLDRCLDSVMDWMRANKWKGNPGKTEALWVRGSRVREVGSSPVLDGAALPLKGQVRSLGVLLEPSLSLEAQVADASVVRSAFRQLRLARQLGPFLASNSLATVVTSRLDYCNAL